MDDDDIKAAAVANQSDENKKPGAVHMTRNTRNDPNDAPTSATTEGTNRIDPSNNRLIRKLRGELPSTSDIDSSRHTAGTDSPFTENLSVSTNAATGMHRVELSNGHDNRNNKNHNNKNTNKQSQRSNITPNHHNNTKHSQRKPTTPTTARTSTTAKASATTDDGGNDRITLQIQDCKSGMTVPLKVRKRTPLERIFVDLYLKRSKGESQVDAFLAQHQFWCHERVLFGGDITDSSSPLDFGLQDMDVIECRPLSTR